MSPMFACPERVPHAAVERLLRHCAALQQAIADALAVADPADRQTERWNRASVLLQQESAALRMEGEAFQAGQRESLLRRAAELRMLARRMDGYAVGFAGEDAGKALLQHRQLLVLTAWQITAAASGSEAAGL